jgi:hypothetical protein
MGSKFPSAIDDASSLFAPVDAFQSKPLETTATNAIGAGDSTISVESTSVGFADAYGILSIDDELIVYTAKTSTQFTGCLRGAFADNQPVAILALRLDQDSLGEETPDDRSTAHIDDSPRAASVPTEILVKHQFLGDGVSVEIDGKRAQRPAAGIYKVPPYGVGNCQIHLRLSRGDEHVSRGSGCCSREDFSPHR